jgi:probable phosphoglycerate mutase
MPQLLPQVYLARHGETAWTVTGQHTGLTDLDLTERGERNARMLGERLRGMHFARIFCSPLLRARRTCELAGFGPFAANNVDGNDDELRGMVRLDPDLVEWNYGEFEGLTTAEIRAKWPAWQIFRDGCPGGESVSQVGARADRVVARLRALDGDQLVFSSGHFLRVVAASWLGMEPACSRFLYLATAALSVLGYEHTANEPVLRLWNDVRHIGL